MTGGGQGSLTFRSQNPGNTPSRKPEALSQAINDQNIVLIDVFNVLGGRDGAAITVARVVVAGVELIADEGGPTTADVLDLGQLGVRNHSSRGIARVRRQDDGGAALDLLLNLRGVNVIAILLRQGDRDGGKLQAGSVSDSALGFAQKRLGGGSLTFLKRESISL